MQPPLVIKASVKDIYSDHAWIHWVGVLSHSSFDHCIPGVSVKITGDNICNYFVFNCKYSDNTKSGIQLA